MVGRKTTRRQRHRHGAEHGRQQRHQIEKFFGPVHGLAHLGPAAFKRLHPHPAHVGFPHLQQRPLRKLLHRRVFTGDRKPVGQAAGWLHQPRGVQVGAVKHHTRREVHETAAAVGFKHDDAADSQRSVAQQQTVAHVQPQCLQQRSIYPDLPGCRNVARGMAWCLRRTCHREPPPQRVTRLHHLECHQFAGTALALAGAPHGRETHRG